LERAVEEKQRKLLKTLDDVGRATSQDALLRLDALGNADQLRALAEELVASGCLRRGVAADTYALTEDGRLALAGPLDVTLYTRPGCHLCDEAKEQIAPLLRRAGARLREVNIDADDVLRERYDIDVPVLLLGARKVAKHRVDLRQFQRQLEEAARSAAITRN
jgi:glutaredoxin